MTTLAKSYNHMQSVERINSLTNRYTAFIKRSEFSHYGIIAVIILIGSCLGSITTMKIFENAGPFWQFIVSLGVTMATWIACLSQAPTKWIVNLFAVSVLVNTILLILNLI